MPNRVRLLREVTQAVADTIGADHTGVRLSPNGETRGVRDSNPVPLFTAALEALDLLPLAAQLRPAFNGPLIVNSDYDLARAQAVPDEGTADAISFGRPFIANPDLPLRLARKLPLARDDAAMWFAQGSEGYVDYPADT